MSETKTRSTKLGLLGYSVEAMEAASNLGYDFVCVVPPEFVPILEKDDIQAVGWKFDKISHESNQLYESLKKLNINLTVPLYEETVEWAGMMNSRLRDNPKIFNWALLFRDKAMMKRRAQMSGIRVGVFEEISTKDSAKKFYKKINEAFFEGADEMAEPIHLKPISAAGSVGHVMVRNEKDIDELEDSDFPCLAESHLSGQEFSVEAFIHNGEICFMNVNEYIRLGYSQILPPLPELEARRDQIRKEIKKLIRAFDIKNSVIHPEFFISPDGELNFGEVAIRVPGGHIFELIERAYGFNPYEAMLLCSDPETTSEELENFFPDETSDKLGHAGNLLVYPHKEQVTKLDVPTELTSHEYFDKHNLFEPVSPKVAERVGFGNHYGKICFFGESPEKIKELIHSYEKYDFYV